MLQSLASDWTRMAKNDIRTKIIEFMNEVDTTPRELAYALAISEGELEQILNGNGEFTLSTFAKLLIATGNALEIKPIEQTPIGNYNNMERRGIPMPPPLHETLERPRPAVRTEQRNNMFNREHEQRPLNENRHMPHAPFENMPPFPHHFQMEDFDEEELENEMTDHTQQPRDSRGRFQPFPRREEAPRQPQSKFAAMDRPQLVKIIEDNLWDSEIDTHRVTKDALVKFLEAKDKRINELKKMREAENDPKVNEFKSRVNNAIKTNPHLRNYLKNLLKED